MSDLNTYGEFIYRESATTQENIYSIQDLTYKEISDKNQFNYSTGFINFSNINLFNDKSTMMNIPDTMLEVPMIGIVSISGVDGANAPVDCSFGVKNGNNYTLDNSCVYGLSLKNYHHIINQYTFKLGGVSINQPEDFTNLLINSRLQNIPEDKIKIFRNNGFAWDNVESMTFSTATGSETNNYVDVKPSNFFDRQPNRGLISRLQNQCKNAMDYLGNGTDVNGLLTQADQINVYEYGLIQAYSSAGASVNWGANSADPITKLVYQFLVRIPLCWISDAFGQFPLMNKIQDGSLILQTNVHPNNSWTITGLVNGTGGVLVSASSTASMAVGRVNPFMLTTPVNSALAGRVSGLNVVTATAGTDVLTFTVKPKVGYYLNQDISVNSTQYECKLIIPILKYNTSYADEIVKNSTKRVLYTQHLHDFNTVGVVGGSRVNKQLVQNITRLRKLRIIPFLSGTNTNVSPFLSLQSSAPNTCSPCVITNLQIKLGNLAIFSSELMYEKDFYNHYLKCNAENGSSYLSEAEAGSTKSFNEWLRGYREYVFDLEKFVSDDIEDNATKQIDISFKIVAPNTVKYDFLFITEFQMEANIDGLTGQVVIGNTLVQSNN